MDSLLLRLSFLRTCTSLMILETSAFFLDFSDQALFIRHRHSDGDKSSFKWLQFEQVLQTQLI